MKMTMHIDEALLERVMKDYACKTKTETVQMALSKLDRRTRLREFIEKDSGISEEEWKNSVDPEYDPKKVSNCISGSAAAPNKCKSHE